MKKLVFLLMVVLLVFGLIGCASTTSQIAPDATLSELPKGESILVKVITVNSDFQKEAELLETAIKKEFEEHGFKLGNNIFLNVSLTNVKRVGGFERFILGIFAGKAKIDIEVELIEKGAIKSKFAMKTEAWDSMGHLATTNKTIDKVAERLVAVFLGNKEDVEILK